MQSLKYTNKCDIWSLGITLYEMLNKTTPWVGETHKTLYNNVMSKKLYIPSYLSERTKSLLRKMLEISEKDRISWEELYELLLG